MSKNICIAMALALAGGLMWGCERVVAPTEQMGQPSGKWVAGGHSSEAVVIASVSRDGAPISGAVVEFSRSIAGRPANYEWSGTTGAEGRARVAIASGDVTGYYLARAMQGESALGSWSSIPINAGYEVMLDLPIGGKARVTEASRLKSAIKIGMLYTARAPLATTRPGAELAVQEVNEAGGIGGRPIQLVMRDDEFNTARSVELAEALIATDDVLAIVGPDWAVHAFEVGKIVQSEGIPMVTTYPTNPATPDAGDFVFMTAFTDEFQGNAMGAFAAASNGLGATTAAILITRGYIYSEGMARYFADGFGEGGGRVVRERFYDEGDTDFSAQLQAIDRAAPDVIFVPGFFPEIPRVVKQAKDMGITATFLGGDGFEHPDLFDIGGRDALEGSYFTAGFIAPDDIGGLSADARRFVTAYTARFGTAPTWAASLEYDAVLIIAQAMARVDAENLTPRAIRDQIAATHNYSGAGMIAGFDENRHPIRGVGIYKIEGGAIALHRWIDP